MKYQRAISIITVAAFTVAQLTGCSIIGYTAGAIYDYKNAEDWYTPHFLVEQLTKKSIDKGRASGLGIGLLIDLIVLIYVGSQAGSMKGFN
jgi:hypothetical protein